MNKTSIERLSKVHPVLAARVEWIISTFHGANLEVVQGLRTFAEQDMLYAQGRTRMGPKVTNARGGSSYHNYGLAVDLCPFTYDGGKPIWNAPLEVWKIIGSRAETRGLEWGGTWRKPDLPHVQLPGLPLPDCLRLYKKGGLELVWKEVPLV